METQRGQGTERAPDHSLRAAVSHIPPPGREVNTLVPAGSVPLPLVEGGAAGPRLEIPSRSGKGHAHQAKGHLERGLFVPVRFLQGSST